MKYFILAIFLLPTVGSYSQNLSLNLDLSSNLELYRQHLTEISKTIDAKFLKSYFERIVVSKAGSHKYMGNSHQSDPDEIDSGSDGIAGHTLAELEIATRKFYQSLVPYDSISKADSTDILFSETKYNLSSRRILATYKDKYLQTTSTEKRISILLKYMWKLSYTYPAFNTSRALYKYVNKVNMLLPAVEIDTVRGRLSVEFARIISSINTEKFRYYAFSLLLSAEKIYLDPYFGSIERLRYYSDQDSIKYVKFISGSPNSTKLIGVYQSISDLFDLRVFVEYNNDLYPFQKIQLKYLRAAYYIAKILFDKEKISKAEFEAIESNLIFPASRIKININSKYYSNVTEEHAQTLKILEPIIFNLNNSASLRHKANAYTALGNIFFQLNEPAFAIKAYYKALHLEFVRDDFWPTDLWLEILFRNVFLSMERQKLVSQNQYMDKKDAYEFTELYRLYRFDFRKICDNCGLVIDNQVLNDSYIYEMQGDLNLARQVLLDRRLSYFGRRLAGNQSQLRDDYMNSNLIGEVYRRLYEMKWLSVPTSGGNEGQVEFLDSIQYATIHESSSRFGNSRYLAEDVSYISRLEGESWGYYWDYIYDKGINHLRSSIEKITRTLFEKDKQNSIKDSINADLVDSIKKNIRTLVSIRSMNDSLKVSVSELSGTANKLRWTRNVTFIVVIFLIIAAFVMFLFLAGLKRQGRMLTEKIRALEAEAEEKDLNRKLNEEILLNRTALGHDIKNQIDLLPNLLFRVRSKLAKDVRDACGIDECYEYADAVNKYFRANLELKRGLKNTIGNEVDLARQYCSILEKMQGAPGKARIIDKIDYTILGGIEVPKHSIESFIANAFSHGGAGKDAVRIIVRSEIMPGGFAIIIEDDGVGFDDLGLKTKDPYMGINLVMKQIENYNSQNNSYSIKFSADKIENIYTNEAKSGVRVTLKIVKNEA